MNRILVCVKWIISPDSPIRIEHGSMVNKGLCHVVNPSDMVAVEEAVRIRELRGRGEVVLLSMGPASAKEGLRRCLAIGADRGILLEDPAFEASDSYATATVLRQAVARLDYDLVICGQRSADAEDGQVGIILGNLLNIPVITSAVSINIARDNKINVHRKLEKGNREVVEADPPALIMVDSGLNKPRYPSLRDIYAAREKEIVSHNLGSLDLDPANVGGRGSKVNLMAHQPPRPKPKKLFTPDSNLSAAERMRLVMSGGVEKKQGNLLEGKPDYIVSNVLRFLAERKLWTH